MKPLSLALVVALVPISGTMVGCSSNSDSGDDPKIFPQDLTQFTLDDYRDASENTDDESILGTWVGVTDIQYTYLEQKGSDPVEDPRTFESRREFMVIRKETNGDIKISSCQGGFRNVTSVTSDVVATFRGNFVRAANNVLLIENSSATFEDPTSKIIVTTEVSGEFIKILDTTAALGSANWNWEDTSGQVEEDIYCTGLNNLEGGGQKISVGMGNPGDSQGSSLQFSQETFVAQRDLYFDDVQTLKRHASEDLPEDFSFDITSSDNSGYSFTFSIQSSAESEETVVGSGSFSVTLP